MTNSCDYQNRDCNCGSNSGFIFGLLCGVVIGAVVAIIIYKNNKTEVFEKLSQKIKDFFDNLVKTNSPMTNSSKIKVLSKRIIATSTTIPSKKEIMPVFVKPKKAAPKTFIKPKK
jgi:gas vesicle protein